MFIHPVPSAAETLVFEYITAEWCADSSDVGQTAWAADTDVPILDSDLLTLDTVVRYKRQNGLDFASEADELQLMFDREKGQDRPSPALNLVHRSSLRLLDEDNLPETGIGS